MNKLILGIFLLHLGFNSNAQNEVPSSDSDIETINEGLHQMNTRTNSISSDFFQIKNLSFLSEKVESKGLFYFQKEEKIRWEYKEPTPYIIIINEDKIYIDNNREQKSFDSNSGKGFKTLNKMIVKCMDGSIANDEAYVVKYFNIDKGYKITLVPKSKTIKSFVKEIQLFLDGSDFSVRSIKLVESDAGDYTDIQFNNKKFNQHIESSIFSGF